MSNNNYQGSSELIYTTRHLINIYIGQAFHYHNSISKEMLQKICLDEEDAIEEASHKQQDIVLTYDFNYTIGISHCVKCPPKSPYIYFKTRGSRHYSSRMIRGVLPAETSKVTVILKPTYKNIYLITAWTGEQAKPELGNISYFERCDNPLEAIRLSGEFWMNHALIDENPTAEELYKDIELIWKRLELKEKHISLTNFNIILAKRLGYKLCVPESAFINKESTIEWLNENLPNDSDGFSTEKQYLET